MSKIPIEKLLSLREEGELSPILSIDPKLEDKFSGVSKFVLRGEYLNENDADSILIGKTFFMNLLLSMLRVLKV